MIGDDNVDDNVDDIARMLTTLPDRQNEKISTPLFCALGPKLLFVDFICQERDQ